MKSILIAALLVTATFGLFTRVVRAQADTPEWSKPVNGLQGRVTVERTELVNGTRLTEVYLALRNVSDVGTPMSIYFDPNRSVKCELLDAKDKSVAETPLPADILTPNPYWLALPYDATLRFRVSVSGYGIMKDAGTMVQMSCGAWVIKPGDHGVYKLSVTLASVKATDETDRRPWTGTLELPASAIPH